MKLGSVGGGGLGRVQAVVVQIYAYRQPKVRYIVCLNVDGQMIQVGNSLVQIVGLDGG